MPLKFNNDGTVAQNPTAEDIKYWKIVTSRGLGFGDNPPAKGDIVYMVCGIEAINYRGGKIFELKIPLTEQEKTTFQNVLRTKTVNAAKAKLGIE